MAIRATFWQAAEKDTAPYWILDTEKSLTLHEIQIVFPSSAVYCYTVDISDDKQQWLTVSDKQNTTKSEQQVLLSFKKGSVNARFVRIRFSEKSPAAISEVIVKGIVRE